MQDVRRRVARVFVALEDDSSSIAGYYTLNAASFEKASLTPEEAKRLPRYPVPAILIGRLAIDRRNQGRGPRETLLMDAIKRVLRASQVIAAYAIVVDAKNDDAMAFYKRYGFVSFATVTSRLYLPLATLSKLNLVED